MNLNKIADQLEQEERFFFSSDNEGHNYLLPLEYKDEFYELLEEEEYDTPEWQKFEDRRIDGIEGYSFTNPIQA